MADSVGLALLVVLETLTPAERLAFVLHDVFAVSFDEIAEVVGKTPAAARQLASRARRRVREGAPSPDADLAVQRRVVDAFLAAARAGDFEALVRVSSTRTSSSARTAGASVRWPGRRSSAPPPSRRDPLDAARRSRRSRRPATVNGAPGVVVGAGQPALRRRIHGQRRPHRRDRPHRRIRPSSAGSTQPGGIA